MKFLLEMTGKELVLLYLATGNADAGRILTEAASAEHEFEESQGITRKNRGRWPKRKVGVLLPDGGSERISK